MRASGITCPKSYTAKIVHDGPSMSKLFIQGAEAGTDIRVLCISSLDPLNSSNSISAVSSAATSLGRALLSPKFVAMPTLDSEDLIFYPRTRYQKNGATIRRIPPPTKWPKLGNLRIELVQENRLMFQEFVTELLQTIERRLSSPEATNRQLPFPCFSHFDWLFHIWFVSICVHTFQAGLHAIFTFNKSV